jgi:hypothetical protein
VAEKPPDGIEVPGVSFELKLCTEMTKEVAVDFQS